MAEYKIKSPYHSPILEITEFAPADLIATSSMSGSWDDDMIDPGGWT